MDRGLAPGSRRELSGLERYAEYFDAVEINSTFYRSPRLATLERWRDSTPAKFRFSAKMPRAITHEAGLIGARAETREFCRLISGLSPKLGALLVQVPPSLELDARTAARFFRDLDAVSPAAVVVEPRHPSWFSSRADELLTKLGVSRAAADPSLCQRADEPGGKPGVSYFRWHGSPRMYFSSYSEDVIRALAARADHCRVIGCNVYCIFDNTGLGAAAVNGLALRSELRRAASNDSGSSAQRPWHSSCFSNWARSSNETRRHANFSEDWSLPMKATALLESQHRKVEALFKKLEGGRSDPAPVLEELANSLAAHMAIEQDIFYPAIKEVDEDVVNESYEEHAIAELALKRLLSTDPEDEHFQARVTTLKELIEHHVEEEEQELFPEVEKTLDEDMLSKLGKEMKARFDEVYESGYEAAVPKGMAKTSADASTRGAPKGKKSHKAA